MAALRPIFLFIWPQEHPNRKIFGAEKDHATRSTSSLDRHSHAHKLPGAGGAKGVTSRVSVMLSTSPVRERLSCYVAFPLLWEFTVLNVLLH